eukprot:1008976-Rhodomonas_salina.2
MASRHELAKLRGKLVWFVSCLHAVRLLTRALNVFVGSPATDAAWDAREALPDAVLSELLHWATTLPTQAYHEQQFWRLLPAQLYEQYLQGRPVVQAMLETDASVHGWGCTLNLKILEGSTWVTHLTSVRWKQGEPSIQVQCEAEALHQALLTFLPLLQGKSVLHVTNCEPTMDLPDLGSARSRRLQQTALAVWTLASRHCIFLSSAWSPCWTPTQPPLTTWLGNASWLFCAARDFSYAWTGLLIDTTIAASRFSGAGTPLPSLLARTPSQHSLGITVTALDAPPSRRFLLSASPAPRSRRSQS